MIKKIISLVLIILFITLTPISSYLQIENNAYAVTTFDQDLESEMFKQLIIPTLISAGLVFSTRESAEKAAADTIDWLKQQGFDFQNPNDPEGPKLGDVVKTMLKGTIVVSAANGIYKNVVEINDMFWELVKTFVDENYDVGDNIELGEANYWIIDNNTTSIVLPFKNKYYFYKYKLDTNKLDKVITYNTVSYDSTNNYFYNSTWNQIKNPINIINETNTLKFVRPNNSTVNILSVSAIVSLFISTEEMPVNVVVTDLPQPTEDFNKGFGTIGIVDNSSYDWSNVQTHEREVVIPIMPDEAGNPKTDENEILVPGIDTDNWIGVTPVEIPNQDPSGIPYIEIPEMPVIEDPDQQTGIMIYIGNILQIIVGQLNKIVQGISQIAGNVNKMIYGIPNPIFDPVTNEPLDPATGEPLEEPKTDTGGSIIGDGIDTDIPTDFEWGDFKHLLDVFYIFIYFIVILILILLKFLSIVFTGLPSIPANTQLFTQYPEILEGVNFIKNLKVGGMSITVQQAFEYIFLIFFYIFVIKQIRKLYNSNVFESDERHKSESGISETNYGKRHSSNDEYENIKITDYTKGR